MTTDELVVDVSQDWVLACDVQRRLMEGLERTPGAVDYGARCRQMQALGGDCYDFMPLIDNRLLMVIGDASGKGLPAALMIASVQSSLRTAVFFAEDNLSALLNAVNSQACASSLVDRYATLFCGAFDGATRMLRYINAGHNPPMIVRRDHSVLWLEPTGPPVGMFTDRNYEEDSIQMSPGDLLLAYTDGVIEAVNPAGEEWGVEGLQRAVLAGEWRRADDVVHEIFRSLVEFSRGRQTDDATVAVLRID